MADSGRERYRGLTLWLTNFIFGLYLEYSAYKNYTPFNIHRSITDISFNHNNSKYKIYLQTENSMLVDNRKIAITTTHKINILWVFFRTLLSLKKKMENKVFNIKGCEKCFYEIESRNSYMVSIAKFEIRTYIFRQTIKILDCLVATVRIETKQY